jgi:hypothetical protein
VLDAVDAGAEMKSSPVPCDWQSICRNLRWRCYYS